MITLIFSFSIFVEILLLENILQIVNTSISNSVLYLIFFRIILSLLFAIFLSYTIVLWATQKRVSVMKSDWMRSIDITDKLPNYMFPRKVFCVAKKPINKNGKLDRVKLKNLIL